jgi:hypothetical protein
MSKVSRMLKRARADLLEVGNVEFEKKAHPLWELEAAGDKVIVNSKVGEKGEDKEESESEEVEVKMEVEQQPAMLPFEQGQLVMFVLGGRSFTGSVLSSGETSSVVQTGVRKYRVENDFLYKVSQMQTGVQDPLATPPVTYQPPVDNTQELPGGMGALPNNLLDERVLDPAAPTPPGAQPTIAPGDTYDPLQPPSLTNKVIV